MSFNCAVTGMKLICWECPALSHSQCLFKMFFFLPHVNVLSLYQQLWWDLYLLMSRQLYLAATIRLYKTVTLICQDLHWKLIINKTPRSCPFSNFFLYLQMIMVLQGGEKLPPHSLYLTPEVEFLRQIFNSLKYCLYCISSFQIAQQYVSTYIALYTCPDNVTKYIAI